MPIYVYECEAASCRHATEHHHKSIPATVPESAPCEKCGRTATRSFALEARGARHGDLKDWNTVNGGVLPDQVPEARELYKDLGVKWKPNGTAVVPGRNRDAFMRRRGVYQLHPAKTRRRRA